MPVALTIAAAAAVVVAAAVAVSALAASHYPSSSSLLLPLESPHLLEWHSFVSFRLISGQLPSVKLRYLTDQNSVSKHFFQVA
jgi:hypothetical protein